MDVGKIYQFLCLYIINIGFIKRLIIFNEMRLTFEISNVA
jgi:hypothetical protein